MTATRMSKERKQSLRKLAKMMNKRHKMPFPINKPLIDCFDLAITPDEVDFLLRMGTEPRKYGELYSLSDLPEESFRIFLATQIRKGFILPEDGFGDNDRYLLAGIMVGWFEIFLSDGQETPEKQEFARRLDKLFNSWRKMNFFPLRNLMNRRERRTRPRQSIVTFRESDEKKPTTIEVNRTIETPGATVYHSKSVLELIEKYGDENKIAVIHCFCRQQHKMLDEPCRFDFPSEACIVIGDTTKPVVDYGIGKYISKDEALKIIQDLRKKGAVHQLFHKEEDTDKPEISICNCCWDCCGVFGSYNKGIIPLHFKSYYLAKVSDASLCQGCGICEEHCPVQAITVNGDNPYINIEKCIGCGQCEFQCPEDAISLDHKERDVMLPLQKRSEARIQ